MGDSSGVTLMMKLVFSFEQIFIFLLLRPNEVRQTGEHRSNQANKSGNRLGVCHGIDSEGAYIREWVLASMFNILL